MSELVDNSSVSSSKTYKFVISGGPCAGKTTAMERLPTYLSERGFRVFVVPEAATICWLNGAKFSDLDNPKCAYAFQQFVIRTQMQLEDSFMNYAKSTGQDSIILCDRGVMDGSAYVSREYWLELLKEVGVDEVEVRDQRYDAVYHLVTCADGADSFYSLANNKGRSESMQAAKDQDRRTQDAWAGHPHHVIIDNRNTFEQKIERLISLISRAVGLPSLARKAHKYLVDKPDISVLPNVQEFFVEKVILAKAFNADLMNDDEDTLELGLPIGDAESLPTHSTGGKGADESHNKVLYSFIRKRSQNKSRSCGLTTVKQLANGEVVELKNVISNKVYEFLKRTAADPTRCIIHQKRYYFLWNKQSFQLYEHLLDADDSKVPSNSSSPPSAVRGAVSTRGLQKLSKNTSSSLLTAVQGGLCTLYVQCQGTPELPPFINVVEEVNGETDEYSAYNMSKIE